MIFIITNVICSWELLGSIRLIEKINRLYKIIIKDEILLISRFFEINFFFK